jgi:hypothetical protein
MITIAITVVNNMEREGVHTQRAVNNCILYARTMSAASQQPYQSVYCSPSGA